MARARVTAGELLETAALVLLILLVLLFNRDVSRVRMQELDILLSEAAREERASPAELLGRYELIRRRILEGESSLEGYRLEARLAVLRDPPAGLQEGTSPGASVSTLGYAAVAGFRTVLGKPPLIRGGDPVSVAEVQEAYLLERARQWDAAVDAYERVLTREDLPDYVRATVHLHLGFCHSMTLDFRRAREQYEAVSRVFPRTEYDVVARRLLAVLEEIERGPAEETLRPVDEGRLAYLYMDYERAISVLRRYLDGEGPRDREPEARYFKGRSHEELGHYREAVGEYRRIAFLQDDQWVREANRRLVMVGEFYSSDGDIAREGRDALKQLQDDPFLDALRPFAGREVLPAPSLPPTTDEDSSAGPTTAELWIHSDPPGALVEVNGVPVGSSPAVLSGIQPGQVAVRLFHRGYQELDRRIALEPGQIHQVRFALVEVAREEADERVSLVPPPPGRAEPVPGADASPQLVAELELLTGRLKTKPTLAEEDLAAAACLVAAARAATAADPEPAASVAGGGSATPDDLVSRAEELQNAFSRRWSREESLRREIARLQTRLQRLPAGQGGTEDRQEEFLRRLTLGSLGVGGTAAVSFAVTLLLGNAAYAEYQAATTAEEAADARARTERFQALTIGAATVAGVALATAGGSELLRRRNRRVRTEEEAIRRRIEELRGEMGYRGELEGQLEGPALEFPHIRG